MMGSYVLDLARSGKTVRRFLPSELDLGSVFVALEAVCQAPSGAISQPWRFIVVTDSQVKKKIREACEAGEKEFYSKVRGNSESGCLGGVSAGRNHS